MCPIRAPPIALHHPINPILIYQDWLWIFNHESPLYKMKLKRETLSNLNKSFFSFYVVTKIIIYLFSCYRINYKASRLTVSPVIKWESIKTYCFSSYKMILKVYNTWSSPVSIYAPLVFFNRSSTCLGTVFKWVSSLSMTLLRDVIAPSSTIQYFSLGLSSSKNSS